MVSAIAWYHFCTLVILWLKTTFLCSSTVRGLCYVPQAKHTSQQYLKCTFMSLIILNTVEGGIEPVTDI